MKRGDLVTVALQGDYGKPRPALVIQSDLFDEHPSCVVLPVTSDLRNTPLFRLTLEPDDHNGLKTTSQVMVDKPVTVRRDKIGASFGELGDTDMVSVTRALAVFIGIG